jgi:hypothetical protein
LEVKKVPQGVQRPAPGTPNMFIFQVLWAYTL